MKQVHYRVNGGFNARVKSRGHSVILIVIVVVDVVVVLTFGVEHVVGSVTRFRSRRMGGERHSSSSYSPPRRGRARCDWRRGWRWLRCRCHHLSRRRGGHRDRGGLEEGRGIRRLVSLSSVPIGRCRRRCRRLSIPHSLSWWRSSSFPMRGYYCRPPGGGGVGIDLTGRRQRIPRRHCHPLGSMCVWGGGGELIVELT